MTIQRVEQQRKELKKIGRPGLEGAGAIPSGISPVLRSAWNFVRDTINKYNRELTEDHAKEFEKAVVKKF